MSRRSPVSQLRITVANDADIHVDRSFVLYWMTSARRRRFNHGLQRSLEWCGELARPLLVLEALRIDYPWASERIHRFVLDGMHDNAAAFRGIRGVSYVPYVEPRPGAARGLLSALTRNACVVVTDSFPGFFLPRMLASAAARVDARVEAVDSNGLLAIRTATKAYASAAAFRRFAQASFDPGDAPAEDPFDGVDLPGVSPEPDDDVAARWPPAAARLLEHGAPLHALRIDRRVPRVTQPGGSNAAQALLDRFVATRLARYADDRIEPVRDATSLLSPYLHFGHVSAWEAFSAVAAAERWNAGRLAPKPNGARHGWWGMSPAAEAFLDQLVTWRELGYNTAAFLPDYERFDTLPEWARRTLAEHEADPRSALYARERLEVGATADPLWNAAQRQLVAEGRIHNYVRMLWGKLVITWTRSAVEAFDALVELNNRWALDGRNPNSYSGIAWCFGRYDHPWPERPIYGQVRSMTSASTGRKFDSKAYIDVWGGASQSEMFER